MPGNNREMSTHKHPDVVVVGNAGVDTNVYLAGHDIGWQLEANFTTNIDYVGQAGGYASRGFAGLGWRTAFAGHLGDDMAGQFVRAVFQREGIDMRAVWTDPAGTARSVNLMFSNGQRKPFYDGKSHMTLAPDLAACRAALAGARLAHFNIPNWARQILPLARNSGALISCDIQDVSDLNDPYRRDFIEAADVLFLSAANLSDPAGPMAALMARKPGQVIVAGLGARGCALAAADEIKTFRALDDFGPVVDTNGAGDSLAVGFMSAYALLGLPREKAIGWGQLAARFVCAQRAPKSSLISAEMLSGAARRHGFI